MKIYIVKHGNISEFCCHVPELYIGSSVMKELRNKYDALFQEFGRQGMEANRKAVEELIGSQGIYYDCLLYTSRCV